MFQDRILSRDEFLRLLKLKSTTLDQRIHINETAFAFGLSRPAHIGEYLVLDAMAMLLASMLHGLAKVQPSRAAEMVRSRWQDWLAGLAQAERQMNAATSGQTYFAVGTDYKGNQTAMVGTPKEVNAALEAGGGPFAYASLYFMSLQRVIRILRENARQAKIELPKFLTPDPSRDEFDRWLEQVHEFRRIAGIKQQARVKKKEPA